MNQLLDRLKQDLQDENARYAYADAVVNAFVSAQIKALREKRQLSQEQLAGLIGTKQPGISRLEKADYSSWKLETLRKLARAFGVRLRISFEAFGTLLPDISSFNTERLEPCKFEDDPVFRHCEGTQSNSSGNPVLPDEATHRMMTVVKIKPSVESIPGILYSSETRYGKLSITDPTKDTRNCKPIESAKGITVKFDRAAAGIL